MSSASSGMGLHTVLLVEQLVQRLVTRNATDEHQSHVRSKLATRLAMRILGARMGASTEPDEAAAADLIRRDLEGEGRPDLPLAFSELHHALTARLPNPATRWALLQALHLIARDRKKARGNGPNLYHGAEDHLGASLQSLARLSHAAQPSLGPAISLALPSGAAAPPSGPLVRVPATPPPIRTDYEVPESALVRDVVFACQGIEGRFVRYDDRREVDAFVVDPSVGVPQTVRDMVRGLCELGWFFKKVQRHAAAVTEPSATPGAAGAVYRALCSALQQELSDYYRLMAVLERQVESGESGSPLTLRRLAVWLQEPLQRMKTLAEVADRAAGKKGGALLRDVSLQLQHGDPAVQTLVARLLRQMAEPVLEALRLWLTRGELEDAAGEFFIQRGPAGDAAKGAAALWREGYVLRPEMLPPFVSAELARAVLRCGRTINFLKTVCGDYDWAADAGAAEDERALEAMSTPSERELELIVRSMAARLDDRLRNTMFRRYSLAEHLAGLRQYLLLCQGGFVRSLVETAGPELSQQAGMLTEYGLTTCLNAALRSSNAQFEAPEVQGALRARLMPHAGPETGWDVFVLGYETPPALAPVFTPEALLHYSQVFRFLWRIKRVEHALSVDWLGFKPNGRALRLKRGVDLDHLGAIVQRQLLRTVRACHAIRSDMQHLITILQGYISVEVLDSAWEAFSSQVTQAANLDALIDAHGAYLDAIRRKSLLHEQSQTVVAKLAAALDVILEFCGVAARTEEFVAAQVAKLGRRRELAAASEKEGAWNRQAELTARQAEAMVADLQGQEARMQQIRVKYDAAVDVFTALLAGQTHLDLKFLQQRLGRDAAA